MTWALLLVVVVANHPTMTSLPGYGSHLECDAAGLDFMRDAKTAELPGAYVPRVAYYCVPGPQPGKRAGK